MSTVKKTLRKPHIAQHKNGRTARQAAGHSAPPGQKPQSFFSLRVVVLLGMIVGISLVAAVILFIGKVPSEIPAVTLIDPLGRDAGPFNRTQSGNIVAQASAATSKQTSAGQEPANSTVEKSKPDVPQGAEADVRLAVTQWAEAWSRRDAELYLAFYANDFSVPERMSRAAWEAQRKLRLAKPRSIKVALNRVEVSFTGDGIAIVRFVQDFSADSYREAGIRKELRLKNENGRWRISSEKVV